MPKKIVVDDYIYLPNVVNEEDPVVACQRLISSGIIKYSHRAIEIGSIFVLISASTYYRITEDVTGHSDMCLIFQNGVHTIKHMMKVDKFANIRCVKPLPNCVELQSVDTADWVVVDNNSSSNRETDYYQFTQRECDWQAEQPRLC